MDCNGSVVGLTGVGVAAVAIVGRIGGGRDV